MTFSSHETQNFTSSEMSLFLPCSTKQKHPISYQNTTLSPPFRGNLSRTNDFFPDICFWIEFIHVIKMMFDDRIITAENVHFLVVNNCKRKLNCFKEHNRGKRFGLRLICLCIFDNVFEFL